MSKLSISQIQNFQMLLQQREQQLLQEIEAKHHEIEQQAQHSEDFSREPDANQSRDRADREIRHAEVLRDQKELATLRAALLRIGEGSYGECVDCEKAIGLPRLQVNPAAMRCIACQTKQENKG